MAPSFDYAISTLFCAEDNDSLFYDESDEVGYACVEVFEDHWDHRNDRNSEHQRASLTDLPVQSEECLALMIRRESELLPACDYSKRLRNGELDIAARDEVLDWITKVCSSIHRKTRKKFHIPTIFRYWWDSNPQFDLSS